MAVVLGTAITGDVWAYLRVIACPLEHFDAIGFVARRVEDFAVAYGPESGAHQSDSLHVAGRIYLIFPYTNFLNFC